MILKAFMNFMSRRTIFAPVRNKIINKYTSYEYVKGAREEAETERKEKNKAHTVIYFHKVDDPYSALTIEYVDKITSVFNILIKPVLVG